MPTVTIDNVAGITVDPNDYFNECRTLNMLLTGLCGLAESLKRREAAWERQMGGRGVFQVYGLDIDGTKANLDSIACCFHWFGVSICNYVRLVGFIRGLSVGDFTRSDLAVPAGFTAVRASIEDYVSSVSEAADVLVWRNKVGAHFAITDPRKTDNTATLDMSVMFPVSFSNGRYRVGELVLTRSGTAGTSRSEIPCWSVTSVFEGLIPRYWPDIPVRTPGSTDKAPEA